MAVIDCLEDSDETLKRKTLELLFKMTNSVNVEFIVDKLLFFLSSATDDHFKTDLVFLSDYSFFRFYLMFFFR